MTLAEEGMDLYVCQMFIVNTELSSYQVQGTSRIEVNPIPFPHFDKGLGINYGEGWLQNVKIAGPKLFAPPPLKTG